MPKFQKLPSEEMNFKSTLLLLIPFFFQLAQQLFDFSQKQTTWLLASAELKYICMYIYSDRAQHFWKPGRLPYTSEKNWRTMENVIISVCPFREEMLYSYSNELNTTVWAITVEQQAHKAAPMSGKHKQPETSWGAARRLNPLKGTEIHLQIQSFFPLVVCRLMELWDSANLTFCRHEIFEQY